MPLVANPFYASFDVETRQPRKTAAGEFRTVFQIDRDRIIHSGAFRRLQSKTQVFLSGEYDFYRTRLTHSIEVAQIGRSLCHWLNTQGLPAGLQGQIDSDLVESACLAHDLGHPPFGHGGERTLHRLMQPFGGFEGNAQTLRLLTETLFHEGQEGINPTRALLDAVLKYKTLHREAQGAVNHYLYDDQQPWLDFVLGDQPFPEALGPGRARNGFHSIECQIMDWADDIAYCLNDLADGVQAGFVTPSTLRRWAAAQELDQAGEAQVDFLLQAMEAGRVEARLNRQIGEFIRAARLVPASNFMTQQSHRHALALEVDPQIRQRAKLNKKMALDLVFRAPALQQLDYKADVILTKLFAVLQDNYIEATTPKLHLMPPALEARLLRSEDRGQRARLVCDWVASMTDSFAFRTYRRLFDANFGSITDLV
jgi:dGTPase